MLLVNQSEASQTSFPQSGLLALAEPNPGLRILRREATIHIHAEQQIVTALSGPDAADREELEAFISHVFKRVHAADIKHFMPQLMSLRDQQGQLLAVCGLRHAEDNQLFLETYLDEPVEATLSRNVGEPVARRDIVEIGNLAVAQRSSIRSLLASVSLYLHSTAKQWAVFTGNPTLRNSMSKLNFPLEILAQAKLDALPEHDRADWGRYYDEQPQVMAARRKERF